MSPFRQYAVVRFFAYFISLFTLGMMLKFGVFDFRYSKYTERWLKDEDAYEIVGFELESIAAFIWILIFVLPVVWVWRKPISKRVKNAFVFLNKLAEGDRNSPNG